MSLTDDRKGRITGSRIAGILGLSPYNTRESTLREMVREHFGAEREFQGNRATDFGNTHETDALAQYEMRRGVMAEQVDTIVHPTVDYLAATPDGLVGDDGLVETKCPYRATYTTIEQRPDYEAQIRLQLECTQRQWCDFVVWRGNDITISRVEHDPDWLPSITPDLLAFLEEYQAIIADPEAARPYLEPVKDQRADDEWAEAAQEWLEAKWDAERAAERLDKAKSALLNLSLDKPAKGFGVQTVRSEGRETTQWSQFVKDQGLEVPEKYRKRGAPSWSVRKAAAS